MGTFTVVTAETNVTVKAEIFNHRARDASVKKKEVFWGRLRPEPGAIDTIDEIFNTMKTAALPSAHSLLSQHCSERGGVKQAVRRRKGGREMGKRCAAARRAVQHRTAERCLWRTTRVCVHAKSTRRE